MTDRDRRRVERSPISHKYRNIRVNNTCDSIFKLIMTLLIQSLQVKKWKQTSGTTNNYQPIINIQQMIIRCNTHKYHHTNTRQQKYHTPFHFNSSHSL